LDVEKGKTLKVAQLSDVNKALLVSAAKFMLREVGQVPSSVEQMELAIHYRRSLTDQEFAALPAEWCAIPAVDGGGQGIVLEQNT